MPRALLTPLLPPTVLMLVLLLLVLNKSPVLNVLGGLLFQYATSSSLLFLSVGRRRNGI